MALRIVEVLQAVLDVAQEYVGASELLLRGRRQHALAAEHGERLERRANAQLRVAAGAHELQRLHDELDLADAAGPQLHVVREFAPRDVAPHFGVQPAHGGERSIVEVLAEHEGAHGRFELRARLRGAGEAARLDPGVALPFASLRHEIVLEECHVADQRARVAVRP